MTTVGTAPSPPLRPAAHRPRRPALPIASPLFGSLAVIAAASSFSPLLTTHTWLGVLAALTILLFLVGTVGALLRLPPLALLAAQIAVAVMALTLRYTTSGIAGIIPGTAAAGEAGRRLGAAWHQIMVTVPPAPVSTDMEFFLVTVMLTVVLVVDLFVRSGGMPALAALPLLCVLAVPAAISSELLPWYSVGLTAAAYAALLLIDGWERWRPTLVGALDQSWRALVIAGLAITAAAVGTTAVVGIGTEGRLPQLGETVGPVALNPWTSMRGDLTTDNPVDTLSVSGTDRPAYLRTFGLQRWTDDEGFAIGGINADQVYRGGPIPGAAPADTPELVTVTPQHYRDRYLPLYPGTAQVQGLVEQWDYSRDLNVVFRDSRITPAPYTLTVGDDLPSIDMLRADHVLASADLIDTGDLPDQVADLARDLTVAADTDIDRVLAVLDYFLDPANGFTYSLSVPQGSSDSALVDFLTHRAGYCEQYATAMAVMLRSLGIPARIGIGFTQGTPMADGSYQIRTTDAHAWVEVRFARAGWVTVDPTPSVDGRGGIQGLTGEGIEQVPPPAPETPDATEPARTSAATSPTAPPVTAPPSGRAPTAPAPDTAAAPAAGPSGPSAPVLIGTAVALFLGGALAIPTALRRWRRRRRLSRAAAGDAGAATAAWEEIVDTSIDHGIDDDPDESARTIANRIAGAAHLSRSDVDALRNVVTTAEQEWYGDRAPRPEDLSPGVEAVITGLRGAAPRTLADRLLPRSLRPRRRVR